MGSPELDLGRQSCSVHGERSAVGRCESCGRPVCLACAVPVRGRVLCASCAARQLGDPEPATTPRRDGRTADVLAATVLGVAAAGTMAPWDRFGPFTSFFSAWRPTPDPWPLVSSVTVVVALAVAILSLGLRSSRGRRIVAGGYGVAAAGGSAACAQSIFGSPAYVSHTPAPYAVLALAALAAALGVWRLFRRGGVSP